MRYQSMPPAYPRPTVRRPRRRQRSPLPLILGLVGIVLGLVVITAVLSYQAGRASVSANNAAQTSANTPTPTLQTKTWTTVQTFSGQNNKKTATFTVPASWKIIWTCTPAKNSPNNLAILVYNADGSLLDGALDTICKAGNTGDTTDEHQGGQVYLDVTAFETWTIKVQVLQ